jgi:hypothetical protein
LQTEDEYDRLLLANSTNATGGNSSSNNSQSYGYSNSDGGAQLSNNLTQAPSPNDTVYASHSVGSQSNFDGSGQLNQGSMQGSSTITSPTAPPSSDHQVVNIPTQITLNQNVSMSLVATMNNLTQPVIGQFYSYFYVFAIQKNNALNFT